MGRATELQTLDVGWSLALDGAAQVVLIAGEPGIGKSALLAAFADRLRRRGHAVLGGRCFADAPIPYQPFSDAFAPLGFDAASRPEQMPRDPETARLRMFEALGELVLDTAADAPVAIALEDLHFADRSSLLLLVHLARRSRSAPVLIVGTYRHTETAADSPLGVALAELQRDPGTTTLRLSGLTGADVLALVAAGPQPPGAPDPVELAALLHRAGDGNPLFVRQLLSHLALAPDEFVDQTGALRRNPPLPLGVRDVLARRLALLDPDTLATLTLAAVIGSEFDLELLSGANGGHDPSRALERAGHAGLIAEQAHPSQRYRFAHDLVHQALYERPSSARRARLHEQVAEALERLAGEHPSSLPKLAEHFAAAARPGHTDKAAAYALQAGRQALTQLTFAEAAALAERGLRCLEAERAPDLDRRCELSLLLAEARLYARDITGCKQAAAAAGRDARARANPAQLAQAAIIASHLNTFGQPSSETSALCEEALAEIGETDLASAARILAGLADYTASSVGDCPGAELLSNRALALARRSGDQVALGRALFVHAEVLGWSPRVEERLALAAELHELAIAERDKRSQAGACHVSALARLESGDLQGFDRDLAEIERLRHEVDYWYTDMFALLWRGMRALLVGDLDGVETHANELLAHARHEPNIVNLYVGQLAWLRREQGRLAELRPLVRDAVRHNPHVIGFRCALAHIDAELGDVDEAAAELDHLAAGGFAALPRDATWTASLTLLAEVAATVCDRPRARLLSTLIAPYSGRLIVATKGMACAGAADRYLGMLAAADQRPEQSERYFQAALELEQRLGAQPLIDRTTAWYRRALISPR